MKLASIIMELEFCSFSSYKGEYDEDVKFRYIYDSIRIEKNVSMENYHLEDGLLFKVSNPYIPKGSRL